MEQTTTLNRERATTGTNPWMEALRTPLAMGLAVLLGAQLLAAVALYAGGRGSLAPAAVDSPLLTFDPKAVTAVRIAGADGTTVTLARGDQGWLIADLADFPADGTKVDALIDKLAGLKRPLPVGTSPEALKRHKVSDEGFERKVTVESGDTAVATLLLGDSPGFRRLFARPAGDSAVYDLELALFDVSNRSDDWVDRGILRQGREAIQRVAASEWTLVKDESGWKLDGSEKAPVQTVVDDLLSRIMNLSFRGVLGTEDKPEYNQSTPTLEFTIGLKDGKTRQYRVSQLKDGPDFVLKVSDRPWYFRLTEFDLEGLKDLNRGKLAGEPETKPDAEQTSPPGSDASDGEAEAGGPGQAPTPPDSADDVNPETTGGGNEPNGLAQPHPAAE